MGSSPFESASNPAFPEILGPSEDFRPLPTVRPREPRTRYVVLFLLTLVTNTMAGVIHYLSFATELGRISPHFTQTQLILNGLWYSVAVLLILGSHEFGHYFACRYYNVDASLPYFIPFPLAITGTLGAVIRIRQPIATK